MCIFCYICNIAMDKVGRDWRFVFILGCFQVREAWLSKFETFEDIGNT